MVINKRMTPQKMVIMEFLKSAKMHPTAEQVFETVKKKMPTITLATVYRNLHILSEEGNALRLEVNKEFHFDGDICCHPHFVCNSCKRIYDIMDNGISRYAMKKISAHSDFEIHHVSIIYHGRCKVCEKR